jgi:quinol monooxygenase YgiN
MQETTMAKVAVIAKMVAAEGKRDELVAALEGLYGAVQDEAKTEVYALHADASDANTVWFYELYSDQDGLIAHGGSDAMKAAGSHFRDLLAAKPELHFLEPLKAKGLAV